MSEILEKRTVKIPPCTIEKKLIQEIGELLESQNSCKDRVNYILDGKTKDVRSTRIKDFVNADWGSSINRITIETRPLTSDYSSDKCKEIPKVEVNISLLYPEQSSFEVSGKDATWVNGITEQIDAFFQKYRQSYHRIKTNWLVRIPLTVSLALILTYPILLVFAPFIRPEKLIDFYVYVGLLVSMLFVWGLSSLIGWLFPYLEYGETKQKRLRKWIWILLYGSGIIPSIILKLLGL